MNTPDYNLQQNAYLAPDAVVSKMAKDYAEATITGSVVRGDYLRVLVAYVRQGLSLAEKPSVDVAIAALDSVHTRLYALVLAAVTTPDISADQTQPAAERQRRSLERNRRSTFARTSKSALHSFIRAGGNPLDLRPESVTKDLLRTFVRRVAEERPPTPREGVGPLETRLEAIVRTMAENDREEAIDFIDQLHTKLLLIVAQPLTARSMQRGELTLTPH